MNGMTIPSGSATSLANNAETYFFTPILATVFQSQMIQILLILGAIYVMCRLVLFLWNKFRTPGQSGGGSSYAVLSNRSRARAIRQNNHDWRMLNDKEYWQNNRRHSLHIRPYA